MISKEEILKLAELSRLELSDGEVETLGKDISNILEYVGQIQNGVSVISDHQTPTVPDHRNIMREDIPYTKESPLYGARDAIIAAFPEKKNDYNVVRKIIQKDE